MLALALLSTSGCNVAELVGAEDDSGLPTAIDEQEGSYGGVGLGSTEADVRAAFGEPGEGDGFFPLDQESPRGPPWIPAPGGTRPTVLRYEEAAFLVSPSVGVYSLMVTLQGATTAAGVEIGDRLDAARQSYQSVKCGEAIAGEPLFGGETPTYPWCRARVGRIDVFFGGDPIESVTLTLR
jgi:hypothetical protein